MELTQSIIHRKQTGEAPSVAEAERRALEAIAAAVRAIQARDFRAAPSSHNCR